MREKWQGPLFYIMLVAGLVLASIVFTGRIEAPEIVPSSASPVPTRPVEAAQRDCILSEERLNLGHMAGATSGNNKGLIISGTVYAADFITPIGGALIESWVMPLDNRAAAFYAPFSGRRFQSDANGHYEVSMPKPGQAAFVLLNYRASYEDHCPLRARLFLVNMLGSNQPLAASVSLRQIEAEEPPATSLPVVGLAGEKSGQLLQGPVDIFLAVSTP